MARNLTAQSVYDKFLVRAQGRPDAVAVMTEGKAETTFGDLSDQVRSGRRQLASWGIKRGSRVGLLIKSPDAMITAYFVVISCATAVPLNPAATDDEIEFDLNDFNVNAVIIEDTIEPRLSDVARRAGIDVIGLSTDKGQTGFIRIDSSNKRPMADPEKSRRGDELILLHTSGTTARPKVIPITHGPRAIEEAERLMRPRRLTPRDRCFNAMPLHHGQGLITEAQTVLLMGASVVLADFDPKRFIQQVVESSATTFTLVPSMHQRVVASARGEQNVFRDSRLLYVRSCSAMLPRALLQDMRRVYGVPVVEVYAASEVSVIAATEMDPELNKEGSVGKLLRDDVAIMDEDGVELPVGVEGEICVKRGPIVFTGYENNPAANAEAFRGNYYRTGDGGYLDGDGYLFLTGRVREVINRGGAKVSPAAVDEVLMGHKSVAAAAAFGAPHPTLGEEVMAVVVLKPGVQATTQELRSFASRRLSFAKAPNRVFIVDELPMNASGKVVRRELAARLKIDG